MGMRPVHTLARGPHLHVDDLVVDETFRKSGAGKALMAYAENDAKARGMSLVFLDAREGRDPVLRRYRVRLPHFAVDAEINLTDWADGPQTGPELLLVESGNADVDDHISLRSGITA